ncbi:MAG: 2-phosphosulfolactate phosphatase [Gammaproteobacteria bacterium]|nr:2-phosphosulfolactate phosphatase [Gammaproteobacteria bacterium]
MNSPADSAPELLVLTHRDQLDVTRLHAKVIVVLDVIFATSSIVAAFAHGIRDCIPAADERSAREYGEAATDIIMAGEKNAVVLDGFAHFAPLQLTRHTLADRTLVFCSTNGAPALTMAARGEHVYAGALLNRAALCGYLVENHAAQSIILECAGSGSGFCLEDFYAAGAFVNELQRRGGNWAVTDSALAAAATFNHYSAEQALSESRVGRLMSGLDLDEDLRFSAQFDVADIVPRMHAERLFAVPCGQSQAT